MIKFSIIIPVYNGAATLAETLKSVVDQSFGDFEIIIMDGMSADRSVEIAKSFNDARVKIFSEKDAGVYDAMNKGIEKAAGEYLYFLGADDILFDNDVLKYVAAKLTDVGYDVVYGDVILKTLGARHCGEMDLHQLFNRTNICHQAIFYKRDVFSCLGKYNLKYKVLADWDFNIRCFQHPDFNIKYFDRVIALYNNESGLSNNGSELPDEHFLKLLPVYYMDLKRDELLQELTDYRVGKKILQPLRLIKNKILGKK